MNEDTVRHWVQKAENDLKIGRDELKTEEPVTDAVCFHMQQCCEKYLKAFLIFHGQDYPKTHRLAALVSLCRQIDPEFQQMVMWNVDTLTRYATSIRYGEEFYTPTLEESQQALELAEKVRDFVRDKLRKGGLTLI